MSSDSAGYLYVPDEDTDELSQACVGARIRRRERQPPWFFVDHSLESVIVARWPGKLWLASVIDAEGIEQACAGGTRAWAVEINGQVPVSRLFGEHGGAVCAVIAQARRLDLAQVRSLAAARHPDAGAAYGRAWDTWLRSLGSPRDVSGQDLTGTLMMAAGVAMPDKRSPINSGFMVVHREVWKRAEALVGPAAFIVDEIEDEKYLEPTWSGAHCALGEAAMAVGAPMLCDDRDLLLAAWRTVFGADPSVAP